MKQKIKNQKKEPVTIPQLDKLPEFEPIIDPSAPALYPDENPLEKPHEEPVKTLPYQIPKPNEF
jgi:hypothetical protein